MRMGIRGSWSGWRFGGLIPKSRGMLRRLAHALTQIADILAKDTHHLARLMLKLISEFIVGLLIRVTRRACCPSLLTASIQVHRLRQSVLLVRNVAIICSLAIIGHDTCLPRPGWTYGLIGLFLRLRGREGATLILALIARRIRRKHRWRAPGVARTSTPHALARLRAARDPCRWLRRGWDSGSSGRHGCVSRCR